ncbi:MAG: amidase, partial [Chloroflexota bacterium]
MELSFLTISEAKTLLSRREISADELSAACLRQIERFNPTLNAFITVMRPGRPGQGATLKTERSRSPQRQLTSSPEGKGELAGIPIAIKDMFEVEGILTTGGSKIFSDYVPRQDAHVISKLKAAGAAIIGKTNMHEIALGVTGANPHYGACRNPWDVTRITGGSSSGSATAVAAGMCLGALGTDTGGSIRIPAALCGVVGMKPTYGRVSLRGVIPLSWNLDHAGPMARTVRDVALLLQVIAGYDPLDPACVNLPVDNYLETIDQGVQGWRVALADGEYSADSDVEVLAAVEDAAKVFEQSGAVVTKTDVSFLGEASLANGLMVQADAAAYHRQRLAEHPDWFGEDVRQR